MSRDQDGPVRSILNQATGGMASGILDANHGSASHDGKAMESSVKVASKDRIVLGITSLNKDNHIVVHIENLNGVHSNAGRFDRAKRVVSTVISNKANAKVSSLRSDLDRIAMDLVQEDDGASNLGDVPEAVVQWSDNVTYDSQIRDYMLA
ncbi:hypothetical protein V6N13_124975 [Hibiscus sabdariffa]